MRKRFYRLLSIRGTDFIACWAYKERISAHAQPAVKCENFYMYNPCWAYAERILSHTEHMGNQFHRMLSILGIDFIACWACAEMFKSRISRPNRIRFSKISCYRPFLQNKSKQKNSCSCTFKITRHYSSSPMSSLFSQPTNHQILLCYTQNVQKAQLKVPSYEIGHA